jgi:PadR family transcriptional regulator, regulatory protein PadR
MNEDYIERLHSKWRSQLLKGLLEFYILLYIRKHQPTHGYAILLSLKQKIILTEDIADGPVYAVLNRLNSDQIIDVQHEVVDGRKRKLFHLNDNGENLLVKLLEDWNKIRDISELL